MQASSSTSYSTTNELTLWLGEILNRLFPKYSYKALEKMLPEIRELGLKPQPPIHEISLSNKDLILSIAFHSQRHTFNLKQRADHGSYYTDSNELETLYKKINTKRVNSVLEPGCGAGCLLINYLYMLKNGKRTVEVPKITAFDMNEKAVTYARLLLKLTLKDIVGSKFDEEFKEKITILTSNILQMTFEESKSYDLVLMNPPYAQLKGEKVSSDKGKYGKGNFTNLFMEYAFNNLKDEGQVLFILGGPSKWGNSYSELNELLLKDFNFIDFLPSLKGFMDINYDTFAFLAKHNPGKNQNIAQRKVNTLCFHVNATEERILSAVSKSSQPLTNLLTEVTRGAYIPSNLKTSGLRKNFISSGSTINSFTINEVDGFCEPSYWKPIFDKRRVILKAKRGKLLHSTVCQEGIATTDNLVNMTVKPSDWSPEGVSLLLNSSFMSYFAHTFVFCSETELARIIDRPYLEKFLVPILSQNELTQFNYIAKRIFQLTGNKGFWHYEFERDAHKIDPSVLGSEVNILLREADEILFDSLNLTDTEKDFIYNKYSKILYSFSKSKKVAA
jgi:tRNA1(Val) A37 N6-methylase TrmN6